MNKATSKIEFIERLAEKLAINKSEAHKKLEAVIETIYEILKEGSDIQITGFGKFTITETKEKKIQSFGKEVYVPAGKRISFKAGSELKVAVK
mgnify:CR=1 FL=1|tara:strand:+ start:64 stop:342 length:279 start_codon:yes stop_codon:yes gene_type:complete